MKANSSTILLSSFFCFKGFLFYLEVCLDAAIWTLKFILLRRVREVISPLLVRKQEHRKALPTNTEAQPGQKLWICHSPSRHGQGILSSSTCRASWKTEKVKHRIKLKLRFCEDGNSKTISLLEYRGHGKSIITIEIHSGELGLVWTRVKP